MWGYVTRKMLLVLPIALGVATLVFLIMHMTPEDPVLRMAPPDASPADLERLRDHLGLNDPLPVQYFRFISQIAQGEFGTSLRSQRPVRDEMAAALPHTMELALAAVVLSVLLGVPLGVISATRRYSVADYFAMTGAFVGISMPSFWLATMLILLGALHLGWFPPSGWGGPLWTVKGLWHVFLPALTVAVGAAAGIARLTRSCMLEVLHQDYVQVARAKGLNQARVHYVHALRNAMPPVMTLIGLEFGFLLGGSVITETIFAWPGMGRLVVNAIILHDFPVVQGVVLLYAVLLILINLVVDLLNVTLDPRIRYH